MAVVLLAACQGGEPSKPGRPSSPSPAKTASPAPQVDIDWSARPTEPVTVAGGFSVQGCPGDAPFLCVSRGGQAAGAVEYFSYAAPAGESEGTLSRLIEDDYRTFTEDREGTCPPDFRVETVKPAEAKVGGMDGMRSEYSVVDGAGRTVERYVKYWATDGERVHLLSAEAQEEGTCSPAEGTVFRDAALTDFEPSFAVVAEGSRFPAQASPNGG